MCPRTLCADRGERAGCRTFRLQFVLTVGRCGLYEQVATLGAGNACSNCRAAHLCMRGTMCTFSNSRDERAYMCSDTSPLLPDMSRLSRVWADVMVCGAHRFLKRPFGTGVYVPLLFPNMGVAGHRVALSDCFSYWMRVASESDVGSPLWTLVQGVEAFYFGITDDAHGRWSHHKSTSAFNHNGVGFEMVGMVTLAAGMVENTNGPWQHSAEGALRLRAEQQFPDKIVINDPSNDMKGHASRCESIVNTFSWEAGGLAAYTGMLDMRRRGLDPVKRGSCIVRLIRQLTWGSEGLVVYMLLLKRK